MATQGLLQCGGEPLPFAYRWLVQQGLTRFGPWSFIEDQAASDAFREEYAKETAPPNPSPVKDIQPFAQNAGNDDVAGFVIRAGRVTDEVLYVHLTWSRKPELEGWPASTLHADVWQWLSDCVLSDLKYIAELARENSTP